MFEDEENYVLELMFSKGFVMLLMIIWIRLENKF